jgi:hypothetical protein
VLGSHDSRKIFLELGDTAWEDGGQTVAVTAEATKPGNQSWRKTAQGYARLAKEIDTDYRSLEKGKVTGCSREMLGPPEMIISM